MTKKTRRRFTPEQKAAAVRRHLADKVKISDLCDELEIQPSVFYEWQKQVFDGLDGFLSELAAATARRQRAIVNSNDATSGSRAWKQSY